MTRHTPVLKDILSKMEGLRRSQQSVLAVFDLDSTLFDVSPRVQKIITDFADMPEHQGRFPEACMLMKQAKALRDDWGIKNALVRAGLDGRHPEFEETIKAFWRTHFFSNEFLEFDKPFEGAQNFVQRLYNMGVDIVYLTGRDVARMGTGTVKVLKKWDFPYDDVKARAVLKPQKGDDDALFKMEWFSQISEDDYGGIWFFENEPLNVNLVREKYQHIEIVFFESTHSGKATAPSDLPRIMHYLLD